MNKFYSTVMMLLALCSIRVAGYAQISCPGPYPPAVFNESWIDPTTGNNVCILHIYNTWPNSLIRVSGTGGAQILPVSGATTSFTDADGYAAYIYPCDKTPLQVSVCNSNACCVAPVPARSLLPVKLTSFNSRLTENHSVALSWTTAMEESSLKYVIEKSIDGKTFHPIGEVNAAGYSANTIRYAFTDVGSNEAPIAFYRLKQVDIDGKYIYSKVVYVNAGNTSNGVVTSVYPNPFRSDIQLIGISAADLNKASIRVYSSTGKSIGYRISGTNAISIDATAGPGIYILQVKDQRFKLIKSN